MSFRENLRDGRVAESEIARWLRRRGVTVLPAYEIEINSGKGPRLFGPGEDLVVPDMLTYKGSHVLWVEAKRKSAFSWYRIGGYFVTGIDLRHYEHYCQVDDTSPWRVYLLFLQEAGAAKDSDPGPSGLYGRVLSKLRACESHRSDKHGASGMVYWAESSLVRRCSLEVLRASPDTPRSGHAGP